MGNKTEGKSLTRRVTEIVAGVATGGILYLNIMGGFAPTMDLLNGGATREQIENAQYSLRLGSVYGTRGKKGPIISTNSRLLKGITEPGREFAYWAFSKGLR